MKMFARLKINLETGKQSFVGVRGGPEPGQEYVLLYTDHHNEDFYVLQSDVNLFVSSDPSFVDRFISQPQENK